jgi:hypothetical protein
MLNFLANIDEKSVNMALWAIPLFAGAAALAAFAFIWWRKRNGVEGVADALGLPFAWEVPCDLKKTRLEIFSKGKYPKVTNQISGISAAGASARFFDYEFFVYRGREKDTYLLTAALFEFTQPLFPAFTLRAEGLFDKLKAVFGWEDIDIPGAEEFSGRYHLSGKDKAAILSFWTPARLAGFKLPARCAAEAGGRWLVFYRFAVSVDARSYPAFIEEAKAAAAALARA